MAIKGYQVLRFKSSSRVDWRATEKAVYVAYAAAYPDYPVSAQALAAGETIANIRRMVKKFGVPVTYAACQAAKEAAAAEKAG